MKQDYIWLVVIVLLLLFIAVKKADAEDWTRSDKVLYGSYIGLSAIDAAQSWNIWKEGSGYEEQNPLLKSRRDMLLLKTASAYVTWHLTDSLPQRQRKYLLWTMIIVQGAVVYHNDRIGLSVSVSF